MTTVDLTAYTTTRPKIDIKRDRYGRYVLPDPDTGEERSWQRMTRLTKMLTDSYNIDRWRLRQTGRGLAMRPDLVALIGAEADPDTRSAKASIEAACNKAIEAAGASSGANWGTAIHALVEQVNRGETPAHVPELVKPKLDAYQQAITDAGLSPVPDYCERVLVNTALDVAGTVDAFMLFDISGSHITADLKTGKTVDYGLEYAMQLAGYAGADGLWNGTDYDPMPEFLSSQYGIIIHLPATPDDNRCELHAVDLATGHRANTLAVDVRAMRRRRGILEPWSLSPPAHPAKPQQAIVPPSSAVADPAKSDNDDDDACFSEDACNQAIEAANATVAADPERRTSIRLRCQRLDPPHRKRMIADWPNNIPALTSQHQHTDTELDTIETVLDLITGHKVDQDIDSMSYSDDSRPYLLTCSPSVELEAKEHGVPNFARGLSGEDADWLDHKIAAAETESEQRFLHRVKILGQTRRNRSDRYRPGHKNSTVRHRYIKARQPRT